MESLAERVREQSVMAGFISRFQDQFSLQGQKAILRAGISPEVAVSYTGFSSDEVIRLVEGGIPADLAQKYALPGVTSGDIVCFAETGLSPETIAAYKEQSLCTSGIIELAYSGILPDDKRLLAYARDGRVGSAHYPNFVLRNIPLSWYTWKTFHYERVPRAEKLMAAFVREHLSPTLQQRLKEKCNLTAFERYSCRLLKEVSRNLNPRYQSEKPVAVVLSGKHDPDEAFIAGTLQAYMAIANRYKLFLGEAETREEAFHLLQKFGSHHGTTRSGKPRKPIELLLLSGHGNRVALNLGATPYDDRITKSQLLRYQKHRKSYLSVLDGEQFRSLRPYVQGTVILDSCETGEGGKDAENLATCLFEALQLKKVYAPMHEFQFLVIDDKLEPHFNCGKARTLVLER
ncbi:MAG TPA: hypothetical protein VJC21_06170 [Candidatus Nanoarchaeia archaeon]|nr:hypothetical protein [Candidatus Nanoarchaeia archaeon]